MTDLVQLVEWRARPVSPLVAGDLPITHAVVDGDARTLCNLLPAAALTVRPQTGSSVCPWCVAIAWQLAAGLLTRLHHPQQVDSMPATQPTQED